MHVAGFIISESEMEEIPVPENEKERLKAVKRYHILDSEAEQNFDDIAELASQICHTSIAVITLIDDKRQWFKAKTGLNIQETVKKLSFCAYTILQDDLMMISNLLQDKRFAEHPMVKGEPHLRFYAGVPLTTGDGYNIGTLAVLDKKPKTLNKTQINVLEILARQVESLLELRLSYFELKESGRKNAYLATLVQQSLEAIIAIDQNMVVKNWNPGAEHLYGFTSKEAIGQALDKLLLIGASGKKHFKNNAPPYVDILKIIKENRSWKGELAHFRKDGTPVYVLASIDPVKLENNHLLRYVIQLRDISERKKLEEELRKINEDLQKKVQKRTYEIRSIFERVSDAFIALDKNWICTYINKKAEQIIGQPKDSLIGKNVFEAYPEAVGSDFHEAVKEALQSQKYVTKEVFYEPFDRWFEHHIYPSPTGVSIYFHDNTDKKKAEEELKLRFEELQKTNYELDQFVYSVSHDLRAPLASILGLVNIAGYERTTPSTKMYLEMIRNNVLKLDGFIKDILDHSRNSRVEVKVEKINFLNILKDVQNTLQLLDGMDRLKISIRIDDTIPFYSDQTRISIILTNLLSNAVKYQDYEKENSYLTIDITTSAEGVTIRFEDNGIGIDEAHLSHIFDMFYRASEVSKGSGIGLYIAKETVSKLGGAIKVSSAYGQSTVFEVSIPNALYQ